MWRYVSCFLLPMSVPLLIVLKFRPPFPLPAVSVREGVLEDGRDAPSDGPAPMGVTPTPSSVG